MARAWHDELHDRKLALYHLGLNDIEIGQDVGRDPRSIRLWRKRHSLVKQKRRSVRPVPPDQEEVRLELYGAGHSDADIAVRLSLTPCAIQSWRNRRGLAANFCAGGSPSKDPALLPITPDIKRRCLSVLKLGVSAKIVARESGVALTTLNKWRARIIRDEPGLRKTSCARLKERVWPSGRKYGKLRADRRRQAFDLYCDGNSDAEIAHELSVDRTRIGEWRAALHLPLNKKLRARGLAKRAPTLGPAITPFSNPIHAQIMAALGRGIAADLIDDAASDMWLAIAEGRLSPHDIAKHAKSYRRRVVSTYADSHKQRSLDEDIGDGDGFRMIDLIRDERSSTWLEDAGATVW